MLFIFKIKEPKRKLKESCYLVSWVYGSVWFSVK